MIDQPLRRGIVIVDHGSRRDESNKMLEQLAGLFHARFREKFQIVEPAHMELAEPSIATAYQKCVERGAQRIVVCPFFLGPGKHWTQDIPRLTAEAAANYPATRYHVTPTLGIDDLILDLLEKRASYCDGNQYLCDVCRGTSRSGELGIEMKPPIQHSHGSHEPAAVTGAHPVLCGSCPFRESVAKPAVAAT